MSYRPQCYPPDKSDHDRYTVLSSLGRQLYLDDAMVLTRARNIGTRVLLAILSFSFSFTGSGLFILAEFSHTELIHVSEKEKKYIDIDVSHVE